MITVIASCDFWCLTAAHCCGSVSFQICHCCLLGWLFIVPGFSRLFTSMVPHHTKCPTAAHWVGFVWSQVSCFCSLKWLCIVLDVTLMTYFGGFLSFKVFHCNTYGWLCMVLCVPLPLTEVSQCCPPGIPLLLTLVVSYHLRCLLLTT